MNFSSAQSHSLADWSPPQDWQKITSIDAHTEGEPLRVIVAGFPELNGGSILAQRRFAKKHFDHLRTALMWEPRGHADMYGCLITPPVTAGADFGVLFLHNEGYSTMCGHAIIGVTTVAFETGMLPRKATGEAVQIDTPAGLVKAFARFDGNRVASVYFHNVPSFVVALDEMIEVPGLGKIKYDLAFGGAFYAYVQANDADLTCTSKDFRSIIEKGRKIKQAIIQSRPIQHPFDSDLGFLYGTIFIGPPENRNANSRNVCVFAEGEVDRSPTGTGVSGRMAIHHARGEIDIGEPMVIESIVGSSFSARVKETTTYGPYSAVIPEVEGRAFITGRNEWFIDPDDPFRHGFILR